MDVTHPTPGRMVVDGASALCPFAVAWQVASSTSDQGRVATRQVLVGGQIDMQEKGKGKGVTGSARCEPESRGWEGEGEGRKRRGSRTQNQNQNVGLDQRPVGGMLSPSALRKQVRLFAMCDSFVRCVRTGQ
jgi:hypothetical protein